MKIWKYSGLLLAITGVIHTIVGIVLGGEVYLEMIRDGLFNVLAENDTRQFGFWFLVCGIFLILFGQTLHYYQKRTQKPAPLSLGYSMLVFSIFGCIVDPISGFWLFIPQALIIIIGNKKIKGAR